MRGVSWGVVSSGKAGPRLALESKGAYGRVQPAPTGPVLEWERIWTRERRGLPEVSILWGRDTAKEAGLINRRANGGRETIKGAGPSLNCHSGGGGTTPEEAGLLNRRANEGRGIIEGAEPSRNCHSGRGRTTTKEAELAGFFSIS